MQRWLITLLIVVLCLPVGGVLAQDGPPELPQEYLNPQSGLALNLPEDWVIEDSFFPMLFVANSQAALDATMVQSGHLFITLTVEDPTAWEERIDLAEDGIALQIVEYYQTQGEGFGVDISRPAGVLDDFEVEAAAVAGSTDVFDQIILALLPDPATVIVLQASTPYGEMAAFEALVYAVAASIHFEDVPPAPTPTPPPPTAVFEAYDGALELLAAPEWWVSELEDGSVLVSSAELDPENLPDVPEEGTWFSLVERLPAADLADQIEVELSADTLLEAGHAVFLTHYPDCFTQDAFEQFVLPDQDEVTLVGTCDDPAIYVAVTLVLPGDDSALVIRTHQPQVDLPPDFALSGYAVVRALVVDGRALFTEAEE